MNVSSRNVSEGNRTNFGDGVSPGTNANATATRLAADGLQTNDLSPTAVAERNILDRNNIVRTGLNNALDARFDYNQIQGVRGNPNVTPEFIAGVEAMAGRLGTRPEYLMSVMSFETGGTFNPGIRNGIGATGLIQFLPSTARGLGTTTDALARMNSTEQLAYVEKYFNQRHFEGRLGSLEGLYTAVLSGRARQNPNDVLFTRGTRAYDLNPLDWNRDGNITAGEAVTPVAARMYGGVRNVQQRLVDAGFVPEGQRRGFADGAWGRNTAAAITRFQQANNLPATGLLDDATGRALFGMPTPGPTPTPAPTPVPTPTPGPTPTTELGRGARGAAVDQLQYQLVRLGFMTESQRATGPGVFGPRTEKAIREFQESANLNVTGRLDRATSQAISDLASSVGRTGQPVNRDLTKGVQDRLVELGYMTRAQVNTGYGTFGPRTEAAIKAFQARNGIQQTGRVGEQTFRAMFGDNPRRAAGSGGNTGTPGYSTAVNGDHYTVNPGILMTDALRPSLNTLADQYFARTGQNLHITSGYRPPARQASAMYDLIAAHGTQYVRNLYANKGAVDEILGAYRQNRGNRAAAVSAMAHTIEGQVDRGVYISDHLRSRALDVSTSANLRVLRDIVGGMGGTVLNEGNHYHIEL